MFALFASPLKLKSQQGNSKYTKYTKTDLNKQQQMRKFMYMKKANTDLEICCYEKSKYLSLILCVLNIQGASNFKKIYSLSILNKSIYTLATCCSVYNSFVRPTPKNIGDRYSVIGIYYIYQNDGHDYM